jgi:hypothetical protein
MSYRIEDTRFAPVDPLRFDLEDLERRRQGYGKTGYAMQFLLDQSMADADRYPLKINDLIVDDLDIDTCYEKYVWANDPDLRWSDPSCPGFNGDYYHRPLTRVGKMAAYEGTIMAVDPSGKGGDETAYSVVSSYGGQLFVLESGGIQGGYDPKVLAMLAEIARRNKVSRILCEENFGQGMFEALLVPVLQSTYPCSIEGVRHHIQKERRICDVLEPLMNSHKLIFNRRVWMEDWESVKSYTNDDQQTRLLGFQISRITRDRGALRHDDRVDALAMACEFWVRAMARDTDRHMLAEDDERQRRVIESFLRRAVGGPKEPPAPNFVTARPL